MIHVKKTSFNSYHFQNRFGNVAIWLWKRTHTAGNATLFPNISQNYNNENNSNNK